MLINWVRECGFLDFSNTGLVYLEIDGRISIVLFVFCLRRALDFDKNFATRYMMYCWSFYTENDIIAAGCLAFNK